MGCWGLSSWRPWSLGFGTVLFLGARGPQVAKEKFPRGIIVARARNTRDESRWQVGMFFSSQESDQIRLGWRRAPTQIPTLSTACVYWEIPQPNSRFSFYKALKDILRSFDNPSTHVRRLMENSIRRQGFAKLPSWRQSATHQREAHVRTWYTWIVDAAENWVGSWGALRFLRSDFIN